jgi:hypothetical protein
MDSIWPASDLLLTAGLAGIMPDIFAYISRRHNGKKYLKLLRREVSKLPEALQADAKRALPRDKDADY